MSNQQGRIQILCRCIRTTRILAVQTEEDGYILHFLDVARRFAPNNKRICKPVPDKFRRYNRICRHLWRTARKHSDFAVADFRNIVHIANPILPKAIRHKEGYAYCNVRLGSSFRSVRTWQPGFGCLDVHPVVHSLRCGIRLLQHQRFALCR